MSGYSGVFHNYPPSSCFKFWTTQSCQIRFVEVGNLKYFWHDWGGGFAIHPRIGVILRWPGFHCPGSSHSAMFDLLCALIHKNSSNGVNRELKVHPYHGTPHFEGHKRLNEWCVQEILRCSTSRWPKLRYDSPRRIMAAKDMFLICKENFLKMLFK